LAIEQIARQIASTRHHSSGERVWACAALDPHQACFESVTLSVSFVAILESIHR
jgi:hypothetical protein